MLPPELPLLQEVASSVPAADTSPLPACLHEESLRSQSHEPADDVPVGMQEPQVEAYTNVVCALLHEDDKRVLFRPHYFNHLMCIQVSCFCPVSWTIKPAAPELSCACLWQSTAFLAAVALALS